MMPMIRIVRAVHAVRAVWFALAAILLTIGAAAQSADTPPHITETSTLPNGIASGDITQSSAYLWTRSTALGAVTFSIDDQTLTAEVTDALVPVKVLVEGLTPNTAYPYTVTDAAGTTMTGTLRTAAADGERVGLRFGVSGDWRGELAPYPSIANADERDLAFFVLHGDTIYADYPSPALPLEQAITLEDFRLKHSEVYGGRYGLNTFADLRAVTSVFALIDDHEVTNDFAGGAAPATDERFAAEAVAYINDTALYEAGLQAFHDYNPIAAEVYTAPDDPRTDGEPRLYRYRTFGADAAIFLVDARSFRDPALPGVASLDAAEVAAFMAASFDPARTMVGATQLADLMRDLTDAQSRGVTWKFIFIPEPTQNFGVVGASDRFEGYAAERTALMEMIVAAGITNVVFVAADIHGTVVNDIYYQQTAGGDQLPVNAFEITTGSVAFDAPFGQTVFGLAAGLGLVSEAQANLYNALPLIGRELIISEIINRQIVPLGMSSIGLEGSALDFDVTEGSWMATHTYGWTEFDIDAETQRLRVTTYGIPPYTSAEVIADPGAITARQPEILSEFVVSPQ